MQILIGLLLLSVLVIVHEFGHFIVAKMSGILVHDFSLFMGPKLFSFKKGETTYAIRAIPLGGYVRMEGEEESSNSERAFNNKPIYIRAAVIAAGPIMNLIAAIIVFFILFSFKGYDTNTISTIGENSPALNAKLQVGDKIVSYDGRKIYDIMDLMLFTYTSKGKEANLVINRNGEPYNTTIKPKVYEETTRYILNFEPASQEGPDSNVVKAVTADSPASKVGLQPGDKIVKLNGKTINVKQDISEFFTTSKDAPVEVTVQRDGKPLILGSVVPISQNTPEQYVLGLDFDTVKGTPMEVLKQSFVSCYSTTRQMYYNLMWLATGKISSKNMMGPIGIVSSIGQVVGQSSGPSEAVLGLLRFAALISINLGIFNLIPFPALDGSKLLLLLVEGIRKKPLPPEREAAISLVGFALLIILMIYASSNDIMRILFKN